MKDFLGQLNQAQLFYGTMLMAVILIRIPGIGVYFRTLNTLLHENGHALAALLLKGEVQRIELKSDLSGSALTKTPSKGKAAVVAFTGYPFAMAGAALLIRLSLKGYETAGLLILASLALINAIFVVRNTYGLAWLITFAALILLVNWLKQPLLTQVFFLAVSQIAFAEAVISTLVILYLGMVQPKKAGDATLLAKLTGIPAAIWALLITGACAAILWYLALGFFPPAKTTFLTNNC